jgi:Zn-dependent protease
MLRSYRLGTLFGFPIRVNLSFLLMLGVVFMWMGGLPGVIVTLLAFASVLLHELGHALVARRLGVRVADIELHFFGGAARMTEMPRSPNHEIAIAAAGPAVSFALAAAGWAGAVLTGAPVLGLLAMVNFYLGAFNLLPAFPSDGGRILRAWLARRRGYHAATDQAISVGRVVLIGLGVLGLVSGSYQLIVIAAVLWMMGSAERAALRRQGGYRDDDQPWGTGRRTLEQVEYIPPRGRTRPPVFVWRG